MAVRIGHANRDENNKLIGGSAGDQANEVCVRSWWAFGWECVLRPKKTEVAEKSAKFIEDACSNKNIGYDQGQRNTLFSKAVSVKYDASKINTPCECDCSSLIHVAVIAAGVNITYGSNAFTTRTMVLRLVQSGDYEKLTDSKYLKSDKYLKRGDILVKAGSHTVMVLEDGSAVTATTKKSDIIYAVKADGEWYPEVKNNTDYAGVENKAITDVMIKLSDDTPISYRVHVKDEDKWLPWVTGYDVNDYVNGYAGKGEEIDAIEIKCDKYEIGYKVSSTANGTRYYSEVKDSQNDYAGVLGRPIDKLMCRVL